MRKIFIITIVATFVALSASAQQKIAYVYSEEIFKSMPEYSTAVELLENYAESAKTSAEAKLELAQSKYVQYKQTMNSLTESQRKSLEQEIVSLEREANNYEDNFFEEGGAMSKKKDALMKPLEDKVISAVNKLAEEGGYDMVLDLSVAKMAIYKNPNLNLTSKVIELIKQTL